MNSGARNTIVLQYLWILFILSFFLLRLPDFLENAFVPDEIWHVLHMQDIKNFDYLSVDNYQGHGSMFWYFGALVERFFGDESTFFILRFFSLVMLTATAFLVIYIFKHSFNEQEHQLTTLIFTLFVLTLPIFWWGGKLIFPEFFQCFLIAIAYYFIYIKKRYFFLAFFFLGFCFGLKLHAGPAVAFFVADDFFENNRIRTFKYFVGHILALSFGFLVCNPTALVNSALFIENIHSNGDYFNGSFIELLQHWKSVLFGRYSEWDLVYFGGVNKTSIPLINLFLIIMMIFFSCRQNKLRWSSISIFLLSSIVALTINQRFLSYYVFTIIILAILLSTLASKVRISYLNIFLSVGVLINMCITVPNVLEDRVLSRQMASNLLHSHEHTQCIFSAIQGQKNMSVVINNSDIGANARRESFLNKPFFLEKLVFSGMSQNISFISSGGGDLIRQIEPRIVSSFRRGQDQFLYLDGERTRRIGRYSEFIPTLSMALSRRWKERVELNIRYLDTCFGTRVNILSVKREIARK